MTKSISVVINTLNEEKNIANAIRSVAWADEILICDMFSDDKTVEVAKKFGAKVIFHKRVNFVEPARNFAISKASNKWILVLDSDEQIPNSLKNRLIEIADKFKEIDFVRIPRKNLIFNKWMRASQWWPDYNIRFFKKGKVKWSDKIHRPPGTSGEGIDLEADEQWAIIHHNYQTISQFIVRMNRYTQIEAEELRRQGYEFIWQDLLEKPLNEFLSRFFVSKGYKDGIHGLSACLLQAFSFLVVYLKLWELNSFKEQPIDLSMLEKEKVKMGFAINYWIKQSKLSKNPLKRFFQKIKS
ncbi:glycosyltransferase family 2 protein [Candidatus Daviesbacteria bacterium]|nr:glycosyltransferase family 2 protein [Candidatus Daviesbacteria bacterium]